MSRAKVVSIIGARPQFVKASVMSRAFQNAAVEEALLDTGQHYDTNMAKIFFEEMSIPKPKYNLKVGSGTHANQTADSLTGIEEVLLIEKPDIIVVYGDTNATIAGALAAAKLHIKIAHIEAGLRSFNRKMPEEINRIVTDTLSDLLFVPTQVAVDNLSREGISKGVYLVGDVMVDALQVFTELAERKSDVLTRLNLHAEEFGLMTIHRPSNADHDDRLSEILSRVGESELQVVFPVHPRSRPRVEKLISNLSSGNIQITDPVGYLDMMLLEKYAKIIITDSGGVQKESYLHKTHCLTIRSETEWVETVQDGWNLLLGDRLDEIPKYMRSFPAPSGWSPHYGDGKSSKKIVDLILNSL